jgi:CubicO group peptidase (beta-lactamase class C family)
MRFNAEELQERIAPLFRENFQRFGELGAALSIWQNGEPVLDLHGGFRDTRREQAWTENTIVLVWSATKGIGSACLLHALQENKIKIDRRVSEFWPEFGQGDKIDVTIAQLVSHSAGLCALDENVEVTDYDAIIRALEKQTPLWRPGSAHGYHARTFGFLIDELVRRVAGTSISKYWRTIFAGPLTLDFWIGLPDELNARCATMYAARAAIPPNTARAIDSGSIARSALAICCCAMAFSRAASASAFARVARSISTLAAACAAASGISWPKSPATLPTKTSRRASPRKP